jgi:signal transduction histidine kinase
MEPGLQEEGVPLTRVAGAGVIALGVVVLAGWAFGVALLQTVAPGLASMKANTALGFICLGAALMLQGRAWYLGLLAALLAAATLSQDLFGVDLRIDEMLVRDTLGEAGAPGRMSPASSLCFLLAGIAAALLGAPGREVAAQWLALLSLAIALVALLGYAYDVAALYKVWAYSTLSLHSTLGFLAVGFGLLVARAEGGWMRRFVSRRPGGALLRQVLVPALVGLFVIGWLRVATGGLYDVGFGVALTIIAAMLLLTPLAWRFAGALDATAVALERMTERRHRHEILLEGQRRCLELVAAGAPLARTHEELARVVEAQAPGMLCSILLLEDGVRVRHSAAPSLPAAFVGAIDGLPIGPAAGSCGTAAFTRKPVIVEDIATDPLWDAYRDSALPHGLRACWSTPIFDDAGEVIGTFALYYRDPRQPDAEHQRLIELAAQTVAISVQRERAEATLRESASRLRSLARRLMQVEEESRRALSRELHDRVGQNLSALNLNLQLIRGQMPGGAAGPGERLADAQQLLTDTTRLVRDVMSELRPPGLDDYGLVTALRSYAQRIGERFGARISVSGEDASPRLPVDTELALFRIAQEALTNAAKHSKARNIEVSLESGAGAARMTVADDGVGFAAGRMRDASWGLATMRERAEAIGARLRVDSSPGAGARITVELPQ